MKTQRIDRELVALALDHLTRGRPYRAAVERLMDRLQELLDAADAVLALDPDAYPEPADLPGADPDIDLPVWPCVVEATTGAVWTARVALGMLDGLYSRRRPVEGRKAARRLARYLADRQQQHQEGGAL